VAGEVGRQWRRRAAALLTALVAVLVGSWVAAAPASAHAQLVSSDPVDGSTLGTAPKQATLRLSESVVPSSVKAGLTDGQGRTTALRGVHVQTGATGQSGLIVAPGDRRAPATIVVELPSLAPDVYRLAWSTLSADDLHTTSGVVVFGVQRDVSGAAGQVDDPLPGTVEVLLRWGQLLGVGLAAGATALSAGRGEVATGGVGRRLRRLALVSAAASLVLEPVLLAVQTAGEGGPLSLLRGSYGFRWATHAVVGLLGFLWLWRRRPRPVLAGVGLLLAWALSRALLGHAASRGPLELGLDATHVAAGATWAGVVAALVLTALSLGRSGSRGDLKALVARTGRVATVSLAVVAVSGIAMSGRSVASVDALLLSTYGRLLLVKLALVGVVLVVALVVRRSAGGAAVRVPVLRVEALVLLAVIAAAGAVAGSRPALGTQWTPRSAVQPLASAQVDDVVQALDIQPNLPGRNFVTVDAYQTRRPAPGEIQRVSVTFEGTAATTTSYLRPEGNGRWVLATDAIDAPGSWRVRVRVERANVPPATAGYDWTVADPQARLAAPVVSSAPLQPITDVVAGAGVVLALTLGGVAAARRRRRGSTARQDPPAGPAPTGPPPAQSIGPEARDGERDAVRS
jgi:copper transport protein